MRLNSRFACSVSLYSTCTSEANWEFLHGNVSRSSAATGSASIPGTHSITVPSTSSIEANAARLPML